MTDFSQFYQDGGIFMHAVTLTLIGALVSIGLHITRRARSDRHLIFAAGLSRAGLLFGGLGAVMGLVELFAALGAIEDLSMWPGALSRATPIALYPLSWALLCAAPVVAAVCVLRFRHAGLHEDISPSQRLSTRDHVTGNLRASAP